jgi:hypothetical protein
MKEAYKNHVWIETPYGEFHVDSPVFDIRDIAHSLARVARFNGHGQGAPYSVAEHSLLVSALMQHLNLGDPLEGLLHDGVEAIIADVPAPFKNLLPDYAALDKKLDAALRAQYGLPLQKTLGCKKADELALWLEAGELMRSKGNTWPDPNGHRSLARSLRNDGWRLARLSYDQAERAWLREMGKHDRLRRLEEETTRAEG